MPTKTAVERRNDRMHAIFENAKQWEHERLERGEKPNPSLTSPEEAQKYGWEIIGREVKRSAEVFNFTDEQFMTASEKELTLHAWERFLRGGLQKKDFTKCLYKHLTLHCSFIAHFNLHGFYSVYFEENPQATRAFLTQFVTGHSVEYGNSSGWLSGSCADLNKAMMVVAKKYADGLIRQSRNDPFEDVPADIGRSR